MRLPRLKDPVLVAGTDGVGTKIEIARRHGPARHHRHRPRRDERQRRVRLRRRPSSFSTTSSSARSSPRRSPTSSPAWTRAACAPSACCSAARPPSTPGSSPDGDFDMAGFAVGLAERDELWGPQLVSGGRRHSWASTPPDVHSNGFSLIRHLLEEHADRPSKSNFISEGGGVGLCITPGEGFGPCSTPVHRRRRAAHADRHLQPRAARPRTRRRRARGGAHHRRRLPRQRRARRTGRPRRRSSTSRAGRPSPLFGWLHGLGVTRPELLKTSTAASAWCWRDGMPPHAEEEPGTSSKKGQLLPARVVGKVVRTRRAGDHRPLRSGSSVYEAGRPDRLWRPQPRSDLPAPPHVPALGGAGTARHRAG